MPSKSKKQYDLMKIASYNKDFADKRGISQEAAREWHKADKDMEKEDKDFYKNLPDHAEDKKTPAKNKRKAKKTKKAPPKVHAKPSMESVIIVVAPIMEAVPSKSTTKMLDW